MWVWNSKTAGPISTLTQGNYVQAYEKVYWEYRAPQNDKTKQMTNHEKHEEFQQSYWHFFIGGITRPCWPGQ